MKITFEGTIEELMGFFGGIEEEKKETVDYDKMTVAELKEIAKEKGISVTGLKKAEIIEKLAA